MATSEKFTYSQVWGATEKYTIIMQNAFLLASGVCSLHNAKRIKGVNNLTWLDVGATRAQKNKKCMNMNTIDWVSGIQVSRYHTTNASRHTAYRRPEERARRCCEFFFLSFFLAGIFFLARYSPAFALASNLAWHQADAEDLPEKEPDRQWHSRWSSCFSLGC